MQSYYEMVQVENYFPMNLFVHSTNKFMMHIHKEIEIILVLEGSINITVEGKKYLLKENDLILVNTGERHSTSRTHESNSCLVFQFDPFYFEDYYPIFNRIKIDCKSFEHGEEDQAKFDIIRRHLARLIHYENKKRPGYEMDIGSETLLLIKSLVTSFEYTEYENDLQNEDNIGRINRILKFIDKNMEQGVTLEDVANAEDLSVYHLSRYFKKSLGMTFQDYKNLKRLDKAVKLLSNTDNTITSIAFQSGFPSVKSLNSIFKRYYNSTPSNYRNRTIDKEDKNHLGTELDEIRSKTYLEVDRSGAFAKLYTYLKDEEKPADEISNTNPIKVNVDLDIKGEKLNHYWKNLMTFGRASEGLRAGWREQFRELQREIGFKNVRFHGIFHDDMMIYNLDDNGNVIYNWNYVNDLFDFFMEVDVKPFIELGFMPEEIKSNDKYIYWWNANVSQPKDINLWTDLVREFVKHCIRRYGLKEVESWYFEVWNEPELEQVYWMGTKEEFFEFYRQTVLAIKTVSQNIRVGGPSTTHEALMHGTWFDDFLNYCRKNNVPLDILTLHIYPESYAKDDTLTEIMYRLFNGEDILEIAKDITDENILALIARFIEGEDPYELIRTTEEVRRIYYEKDHTSNILKNLNLKLKNILSYDPEIHIVEWGSTSFGRNFISDTCYTSTFIVSNVIESIGLANSLGYWTFTDIMEEFKAGIQPFHGGFGLMNNHGLKKPGYYAYWLLSKLGDEIIHRDREFIMTKKGEDIQILAYNYAYFDDLFMQGDTSALSYKDRYGVFEVKDRLDLDILLKGLKGSYKSTRYKLDRENGSVFDEWLKLGSPENMTKEEISYLKSKSQPSMIVENINIGGELNYSLSIPVHGIELITLKKQ